MAATTDKRTTLALILIALVTLAYLHVQQRYRERLKRPQEAAAPAETPETPPVAEAPAAEPAQPVVAPPAHPPAAPAAQEAPEELLPEAPAAPPAPLAKAPDEAGPVGEPTVEEQFTFSPPGAMLRLLFSTRGGQVKQVWLLDHRTSHENDQPLAVLSALDDLGSLLLVNDLEQGPALDAVNYTRLEGETPDTVGFRCRFADGLVVTKRYRAATSAGGGHAANHHVTLDVTFANEGPRPAKLKYALTSAARIVPEYFDRNYVEGLIATSDPRKGTVGVDRISAGRSLVVESNVNRPIIWVGSANKYFAALLAPKPEKETAAGWIAEARAKGLEDADPVTRPDGTVKSYNDNIVVSLASRAFTVAPGEQVTHRYLFYVGPKDRKLLSAFPEYRPFQNVISYGWFEWFSSVLLALLDLFHRLIPNYGVAIILLTFTVRLALHPLTRKSQVSMHKMQRLQPEIKKLQEKYKGDRQRLAKEQMELFRREGVNPMGGCWPMLLQLPIIIGLFRAVQLSVDLRGAPFVLWVYDLSRPDTVGHIAGRPINILPLFMLASWIGQQALMPKPPDPQQAKQQRLMMIMTTAMFGIFFYSIASGVVLYWLTSTLVGIIEQRLIKRSLAGHAATVQQGAAAAAPANRRRRKA